MRHSSNFKTLNDFPGHLYTIGKSHYLGLRWKNLCGHKLDLSKKPLKFSVGQSSLHSLTVVYKRPNLKPFSVWPSDNLIIKKFPKFLGNYETTRTTRCQKHWSLSSQTLNNASENTWSHKEHRVFFSSLNRDDHLCDRMNGK